MKDFAEAFYRSKAWRDCRAAYLAARHHLCERCLKYGQYTGADTVHHKSALTPENINDPSIALSWDNLMAVCRDCHAAMHATSTVRYTVDAAGKIFATEAPQASRRQRL